MFALPTIDHRMTLDEFLEWIETQESRHYMWDGEVFPVHPPDESEEAAAMAGASARHARVMMRAMFALETALRGRGCTTYSGDLGVLLSTTGQYVFPDLSVVCGEPEFADASQRVLTNPTLVLEVLSPSTEAFDCGSKATAYRRLPSLKALVLVSQDRLAAEIYRREGARWTVEDAAGLDATVSLLGADVALADLYDGVEFPERVRPPGFG